MRIWAPHDASGEPVAPWAVIVGLHGMNDYSAGFGLPAEYWAARGICVYAYDQRGFGASAGRGVWPGERSLVQDLRTACALVHARHPDVPLTVVGESMGGAVSVCAFASSDPPIAERLVLAAPAVWGWSTQPITSAVALWLTATTSRRSSRRAASSSFCRPPTSRRSATLRAAGGRTAYYAEGYHLLLRDLHRRAVCDDVLAFMRDDRSPPPSGAPAIPRRVERASRGPSHATAPADASRSAHPERAALSPEPADLLSRQ